MAIEYLGLSEINGPLVVLEGVKNASFEEIVEFHMDDGTQKIGRIIEIYEGNKLEVKNGVIYINDQPAKEYTFKMDYYFMMGDNRHNSADSRFWGFVPEDHIVGKASMVLFSTDKEKSFPKNIRWNRMFTRIK